MSANRSSGIGRREFIVGLGGAGLAAGLGSGMLSCSSGASLHESLAQLYTDREAARLVGRIYLNTAPDEGDPDVLLVRLAGEDLASWQSLAGDRGALFDAVRARHRSDFEHGRTASVDGWVLSLTEARLCALAALG